MLDDEGNRIPYRAEDLAGRRWLVLAPHPDDEVLGPGGTLAKAARTGVELRIVIVTDGSEGGAGTDLVARREAESREAATRLGTPQPVFLAFPDRGLRAAHRDLRERLAEEITSFRPDLVLVPSPLELHPDHRAVAEAIIGLASAGRIGESVFETLRHGSIAFYEVATPLGAPNRLVDVSGVVEAKRHAMKSFSSQDRHDYAAVAEGLLGFRRLTLATAATAAEAFHVVAVAEVAALGLGGLLLRMGVPGTAGRDAGVEPLSVVVRTRDRPGFLRQALRSLADGFVRPAAVVVVNDGGVPVDAVLDELGERLNLVRLGWTSARGRVAAANAGAARVQTDWFAFLDDDDVVYPDHLETLGRALREGGAPVVYSDAVVATYRREEGDAVWRLEHRHLQYSHDFDRGLLTLANYIPLHTAAIPTASFRDLGGFDASLDLSEDWDFLLRLSERVPFLHLRRVTCEYRTFVGPGSPAHAPAGNAAFQSARREIYRRHSVLREADALAAAVDALRREEAALAARNWTLDGELIQARTSAAEWERQVVAARREFERLGHERAERERELEQLGDALRASELRTRELDAERSSSESARAKAVQEVERLTSLLDAAHDTEAALREQIAKETTHLGATYEEIARLNGILATVERSKAWRLHRWLERVRRFGRRT